MHPKPGAHYPENTIFSSAYGSSRSLKPVEGCWPELKQSALRSYKIIYGAFEVNPYTGTMVSADHCLRSERTALTTKNREPQGLLSLTGAATIRWTPNTWMSSVRHS